MTGRNDSSPYKMLSELNTALELLKGCKLFVVNVFYNIFHKTSHLNNRIKLLTKNFDNCVFIKSDRDLLSITRTVIHHVNTVQYDHTFLTFANKKAGSSIRASCDYLQQPFRLNTSMSFDGNTIKKALYLTTLKKLRVNNCQQI